MENYTKGIVVDVEESLPLSVTEGGVVMKVVPGSKIRNLLNYALKKLREPETTQVLWHGSGKAIYKAINCAEIMKRKAKNLHQITQLYEKRVEEYWEPKMEGLDRLKVNRDIPAICILLSETELDSAKPGYQPPGPFAAYWSELTSKPGSGQRSRRPRPQVTPEGNQNAGGWKNKKRRRQEKKAAMSASAATTTTSTTTTTTTTSTTSTTTNAATESSACAASSSSLQNPKKEAS